MTMHASVLVTAGLTACSALIPVTAHAASESVIYAFLGGKHGQQPVASLIKVGSELYGTTTSTVFSLTFTGKQKVLHAFQGCADGRFPDANLVNLNDTLYGTTPFGGDANCGIGMGTAFSVTPQGAYSVLYRFSEASGGGPAGKLTPLHGVLYGTTSGGGAENRGTVFSLTPQGALTVLHTFSAKGGPPVSGLTLLNGRFYGTTGGDVFEVSPSGAFKVVYTFQGGADGANPVGNLLNVGGTLYGVTQSGGTGAVGTIFSVTPEGAETVLYSFPHSESPLAPLIYVDGLFYSTAGFGCGKHGCVFSFTPQGVFTTIYTFKGGSDGGSYPFGGLLDVNGVLYGTTYSGGNGECAHHLGCGTVFKIMP